MELQEGIVLKTINYKENSKIVYILTDDGLKSALVRAANKFNSKNFSYAQEVVLMNFGLSLSNKSTFDILTSAQVISSFPKIKTNYELLNSVMEFLALAYQVHEYVNDNHNFYLLTLFTLKKCEESPLYQLYIIIFKLKLLYLLGVGPNFSNCCFCNKPINKIDKLGFSIDDGSIACLSCLQNHNGIYVSDEYLKLIPILYFVKLDKCDDELLKQIPDIDLGIQKMNYFLKLYYEKFLSIKLK